MLRYILIFDLTIFFWKKNLTPKFEFFLHLKKKFFALMKILIVNITEAHTSDFEVKI